VAQDDLCDQELEAIAAHGGRTGESLVLINDRDGSFRPAQFLGALHEVVLAGRAGGVFTDLKESGLSDVNKRRAFKMVQTNLGTAAWESHDRSPE